MGVVEWGVRFGHSTLDGEDCGERDPKEMSTNTMEFWVLRKNKKEVPPNDGEECWSGG